MVDWSHIKDNKVELGSLDIVLSAGFKLVYGLTKQAIRLEKTVAKIAPKVGSCLLNLDQCLNGVNFRLNLKVPEYVENTYYIGGGGENPAASGIALMYKFGKIQVRKPVILGSTR